MIKNAALQRGVWSDVNLGKMLEKDATFGNPIQSNSFNMTQSLL